jgi:hypothetical protein
VAAITEIDTPGGKGMKCPVMSRPIVTIDAPWELEQIDCLKADCAWWDDSLELCSVRVIAQFMVGTGVGIRSIADRMPFKVQL